jgi:hypothetical protein
MLSLTRRNLGGRAQGNAKIERKIEKRRKKGEKKLASRRD